MEWLQIESRNQKSKVKWTQTMSTFEITKSVRSSLFAADSVCASDPCVCEPLAGREDSYDFPFPWNRIPLIRKYPNRFSIFYLCWWLVFTVVGELSALLRAPLTRNENIAVLLLGGSGSGKVKLSSSQIFHNITLHIWKFYNDRWNRWLYFFCVFLILRRALCWGRRNIERHTPHVPNW